MSKRFRALDKTDRERERERQKEHTKRRITQMCFADVRYDTIRDAILTCARMETTTKKWKMEKLKSKNRHAQKCR